MTPGDQPGDAASEAAWRFRGRAWRHFQAWGLSPELVEDLAQEMVAAWLDAGRGGQFAYLALHALDRVDPRIRQAHGNGGRRSQREVPFARHRAIHDKGRLPDVLLWAHLMALPPWHGVSLGYLLYLRYVEDWRAKEIAAHYGVHEARLSQLLKEARGMLKKRLEETPRGNPRRPVLGL